MQFLQKPLDDMVMDLVGKRLASFLGTNGRLLLRKEKREIEGRLFEHGTMEERKRVVRAFVEGITVDAASQSAELTMKKLPEPDLVGAGSSFVLVAGAGFEPATFGL